MPRVELVRTRSRGFDRLVRDLRESERTVVADTRAALRDAGPKLVATFRRAAPEESGRLKDSIDAVLATLPGGSVRLRVLVDDVQDPRTGFPYLDVTRYGRGPVAPVRARRLVLHLGRDRGGSARELVPLGVGQTLREWRPSIDWVEVAERRARRQISTVERDIGRRLSTHGITRGT